MFSIHALYIYMYNCIVCMHVHMHCVCACMCCAHVSVVGLCMQYVCVCMCVCVCVWCVCMCYPVSFILVILISSLKNHNIIKKKFTILCQQLNLYDVNINCNYSFIFDFSDIRLSKNAILVGFVKSKTSRTKTLQNTLFIQFRKL